MGTNPFKIQCLHFTSTIKKYSGLLPFLPPGCCFHTYNVICFISISPYEVIYLDKSKNHTPDKELHFIYFFHLIFDDTCKSGFGSMTPIPQKQSTKRITKTLTRSQYLLLKKEAHLVIGEVETKQSIGSFHEKKSSNE
jgi:hypothetical protein